MRMETYRNWGNHRSHDITGHLNQSLRPSPRPVPVRARKLPVRGMENAMHADPLTVYGVCRFAKEKNPRSYLC